MLLPRGYSLGIPHTSHSLCPLTPPLPSQLPAQETCSQSRMLIRLKFSSLLDQLVQLVAGLADKFSARCTSWCPSVTGWLYYTEGSHGGAETSPLFNTQLITSHCLLLPKGEVSLPSPHPSSSLLCSKPQSHPFPCFQHWHSNLSASWFSSHRSQEAIPAPPHPERWFNSKSASSEIWERVGMWSQEGGEPLPCGDQLCQLSIPKPFLHTDWRPSETRDGEGKS